MTPMAPAVRPQLGKKNPWMSMKTVSEMAVPAAVLGIVLALIAPMPAFLLDFLIVCDIMMSVIVLMVAMYITKPVDFNVFPTTLLMLTLFRLALNVSSARLILLNGHTGTSAAGDVIQAFGNFVVGGNYIIGAVIFLVLIAIQYVVINHGAVRISEVTARFTLDALPGKQMSIDSDLNAGLIDETTARRRRRELAAEAEFFGAMDGASRFTQRDAVAGVLITGINIIAGLLIGVLQHGLDISRALQTYTVLTIGDGLVTVIPALMISISGGMIITRASSDNRFRGRTAAAALGGRADRAGSDARTAEAAVYLPGRRSGHDRLENEAAGPDYACRGRRGGAEDSEGEPRRSAAGGADFDRSGREPGFVYFRRREFASASANRRHPEATGVRPRVHHSGRARNGQPEPARARVRHQS
jgi:flagellar biosynthesis protein FlhA